MGDRVLEMQLLGISSVLHWAMLFLHLATFKTIGVLVIIVFKMLIGDIFKFVIVYLTLVMAFSVAFFRPSSNGGCSFCHARHGF
mmetsp:Transcript_7661/g.18644  ORF Transcript_7661/g.18644 Transcript_7661/m.18644 type:complete len:84 (+) Transcript_7661:1-252(+)